MEENIKLTQAQMKALRFFYLGFKPSRGNGISIMMNEIKVCNIDTLTSMVKKGVLTETIPGEWCVTEKGLSLANKLFS